MAKRNKNKNTPKAKRLGPAAARGTSTILEVPVDLGGFGNTYGRGTRADAKRVRSKRFSGANAVGDNGTNRPASSKRKTAA